MWSPTQSRTLDGGEIIETPQEILENIDAENLDDNN